MRNIFAIVLGCTLALTASAENLTSPASSSSPDTVNSQQLYALLENGILVLTVEPCDAEFHYPTLFAYAAYAVVPGQADKTGCWFNGGEAVNMVFPDQPGVHTWAGKLLTPYIPAREE